MNCRNYSKEERILLALCSVNNSKLSRDVELALRLQGTMVIKPTIDPRDYTNARAFFKDYVISSYLSKWKGWGRYFTVDTKAAALTSWIASESECQKTNQRLTSLKFPYGHIGLSEFAPQLSAAREKIKEILGRCRVDDILSYSDWTNGSSLDTKYSDPFVKKLSTTISATSLAIDHLRGIMAEDPHWAACFTREIPEGAFSVTPSCFKCVDASRFSTVPKNALTDRCIAVEPAGNVFLQKGIGSYITARLARHGVRKDQEISRLRASLAHTHGLATLDLKAASDSVSIETVRLLLPDDWFDLLNATRTRYTLVNKKKHLLAKFSSMGNGFTFELETLIFYALCRSISDDVTVFGDDIILPAEHMPAAVALLAYCGFTVNSTKSYGAGSRFFESCGHHYFDGHYVTPTYQKEVVTSINSAVTAHNRIYRLLENELWDRSERKILLDALRDVFGVSERKVRAQQIVYQPSMSQADLGFCVPISWIQKYDRNRGYRCRVWIFTPTVSAYSRSPHGLLAYKYRSSSRFIAPAPLGRVSERASSSYTNPSQEGWDGDVRNEVGTWTYKFQYVQPWFLIESKPTWMTSR